MLTVKKLLARWQSGRWQAALVVLAIFSVSLSSVAQDDRIPLPDMGNSAGTILSEKEEKEYGNALIRQMRAYEVLVEDPQISAYFQNMGFRLVAQSDRPEKPFHFVVLDEPNVNAFAAPGGVMGAVKSVGGAIKANPLMAAIGVNAISSAAAGDEARKAEEKERKRRERNLDVSGVSLGISPGGGQAGNPQGFINSRIKA